MREISSTQWFHGSQAVGVTRTALTAVPNLCQRGVTIKADAGNGSAFVYVGKSTVTAGIAAAATDGFKLAAGQEVFIECSDPTSIYVIGSAGSLAVSWIGA